MSTQYIVANWKMNQSFSEIEAFTKQINTFSPAENKALWVAPQGLHISKLRNELSKKFLVGAQNSCFEKSGAFTGESSPVSLKEAGADFVILGHSERRKIFHENDGVINRKVKLALECDLKVVFCLGETLEERDSGKVEKVLENQLRQGLVDIEKKYQSQVIIAYEPVWAIGTGKNATSAEIEKAHLYISEVMKEFWGNCPPILYGGSVKPENATQILGLNLVGGILVGGASLKAESFLKLATA